jgi:hypothetical protein
VGESIRVTLQLTVSLPVSQSVSQSVLVLTPSRTHDYILVVAKTVAAFFLSTGWVCNVIRRSPCLCQRYPKVSGLSHNEIYAYNNKHSLRCNTKGYGGKLH